MSNQAEDLQSDQEDKPTKLGVWRESLGLEAPMRWSQVSGKPQVLTHLC